MAKHIKSLLKEMPVTYKPVKTVLRFILDKRKTKQHLQCFLISQDGENQTVWHQTQEKRDHFIYDYMHGIR